MPATPPRKPTRRERARRIRRVIAAGATATFIALWGGVYVQMQTGNDPALGAGQATVTTAEPATAEPSTTTDETTVFAEEELPAVTTSQS